MGNENRNRPWKNDFKPQGRFETHKEVPNQNEVNTQIKEVQNQNEVKEETPVVNEVITEPFAKPLTKSEPNIHNTNYLDLDKESKENLNINGILFKHGTVIKCNMLNFREKPDKTSKIIGTFNNGDNILYSETDSPDWYILKDKNGKIGYCMSEFIKVEV